MGTWPRGTLLGGETSRTGLYAIAPWRAASFITPQVTPELAAAIDAGSVPPRLQRVLDDAVGLIPMGRPAGPDEVAATVAYLARPDAGFVTGQTISGNGGSSMG